MLPEVVTVRAMVLSIVVLLALVVLLPTVRAYVNQTGELRALRAQLASANAEHAALEDELSRWDDREFVIRQARDHLNFVMPGDTPWRVLDAGTVEDPDSANTAAPTDSSPSSTAPARPWYEAIWQSVQVADRS